MSRTVRVKKRQTDMSTLWILPWSIFGLYIVSLRDIQTPSLAHGQYPLIQSRLIFTQHNLKITCNLLVVNLSEHAATCCPKCIIMHNRRSNQTRSSAPMCHVHALADKKANLQEHMPPPPVLLQSSNHIAHDRTWCHRGIHCYTVHRDAQMRVGGLGMDTPLVAKFTCIHPACQSSNIL